MPTSAIVTYGAGAVYPLKPSDSGLEDVNLKASTTFAEGTIIGEITASPGTYGPYASSGVGVSEVQTLTIGGTPTGGTFELEFGGQITAPIAYNASAATVQTALQALASIGSGNATVSGGALPGAAVVVTFAGALANMPQPLISANIGGLTGGTPTFTAAHTTPGSTGAPTDGTQNPQLILQYACQTDASGNITIGTGTAGQEWGQTYKGAPAYRSGEFSCADIPNLDANAVAKMGRLTQGTPSAGRFLVYGT